MEQVLTFLSKPIIVTLLSLLVGSYLFTLLTERRAKREKVREKAIQLIEETGNDLNAALSSIYGYIYSDKFSIKQKSLIIQTKGVLFTKRFNVRVRSQAYLKNKEFWKKYEYLVLEIDKLIHVIASIAETADLQKIVEEIERHQRRLSNEWLIDENKRESRRVLASPSKELYIWANMIWDRAFYLLATSLKAELR